MIVLLSYYSGILKKIFLPWSDGGNGHEQQHLNPPSSSTLPTMSEHFEQNSQMELVGHSIVKFLFPWFTVLITKTKDVLSWLLFFVIESKTFFMSFRMYGCRCWHHIHTKIRIIWGLWLLMGHRLWYAFFLFWGKITVGNHILRVIQLWISDYLGELSHCSE